MKSPELRQFGELGPEDFVRHPVWILCHTADYKERWYKDTDEDTFRPWTKELPAIVLRETLLVRADLELWDGSHYSGFITPLVDGHDTLTGGGRPDFARHPFARQQPNIFVGDSRFGFWGGRPGISKQKQHEFYSAIGKQPEQIFPLQFHAEDGLANGLLTGRVEGFYRSTRDGSIHVDRARPESPAADVLADVFRMRGTITSGYPQPESVPGYRNAVYSEYCPRCGIYGPQKAPFRFKKSVRIPLSGFTQLGWVGDTFFVSRDIADEIVRAGITGVSFGPAVSGRPAVELGDRVQMLIPTLVACAETSELPPVTCRSNNEEAVRIRAMIEERRKGRPPASPSPRSLALRESLRKLKEKKAAIPFCGRIKHHAPTSLAIIPDSTASAPDLFQTAEWFGSGACAFRLTLASRRFADLVRDRGWKGLEFRDVRQSGFSARE
jgi:hypothetical protein